MAKRERPKPNVTFHYDGDAKDLEDFFTYFLAEIAAKKIMKSIAEDMQADSSK